MSIFHGYSIIDFLLRYIQSSEENDYVFFLAGIIFFSLHTVASKKINIETFFNLLFYARLLALSFSVLYL